MRSPRKSPVLAPALAILLSVMGAPVASADIARVPADPTAAGSSRTMLQAHGPERVPARDRRWKDWSESRRHAAVALENRRTATDRARPAPTTLASSGLPFGIGHSMDLPAQANPLVTADFDQNNRPDFAATSELGNRVVIGINDGLGGFTLDSLLVADPVWLAPGDFDHDGHVDLAVLCASPATLHVYHGRGDGRFDSTAVVAVGTQPFAVAAADLDRDGRDDLVITESGDDSIAVYLATAAGFAAPVSYGSSPGPATLLVTDFNQDTFPDVAVTHLYSSDLALYLNMGGGVLAPPSEFAGSYVSGLAAADLNGDGWVDLAAADGYDGLLQIYWNNGLSAFGSRDDYPLRDMADLGSVAIGDLDQDGRPDLVALAFDPDNEEAWAQLFFQRPEGDFDASFACFIATAYSGRSYGSVAIADVDGLKGLDLVITQSGASTFQSGGAGLLVVPHLDGRAFAGMADVQLPNGTPIVQAVDFERRGRRDVIVDTGEGAYLVRSRFDGLPNAPVAFPEAVGAIALDLNGDARTDLLTPSGDSIVVRLCGSQGTMGPPTLYPGVGVFLRAADFNGDGRPDALVRRAGDSLAVLMNQGSGTFGAPRVTNLTAPPSFNQPVGAGDLNRDGRSDLVLGRLHQSGSNPPPPDSVRVFLADSLLLFHAVGTYAVGRCTGMNCSAVFKRIEVIEVTGDSLADVVAFSNVVFGPGLVSVLRNHGGGALDSAKVHETPSEDQVYFLGDLDGDGDVDLVAASYDDLGIGRLWLSPNSGNGTFGPGRTVTTPNYPRSLGAGDLNGDGRMDLIVGYRGLLEPPGLLVLRNNEVDPPALAVSGRIEGRFDAGRVRLAWQTDDGSIVLPSVERRSASRAWTAMGVAAGDGRGWFHYEDAAVRGGERYAYRLAIGAGADARYSPIVEVDVPSLLLAVESIYPNPARGPLFVRFSLMGEERAALELIDVAGRRVARQDIEHPAAGPRSARFASAALHPGVYWVRLSQGGRAASASVTVAR